MFPQAVSGKQCEAIFGKVSDFTGAFGRIQTGPMPSWRGTLGPIISTASWSTDGRLRPDDRARRFTSRSPPDPRRCQGQAPRCTGTATIDGIAAREACSKRHVSMTISLAVLAPNLVKAAVDGRLPRGIGVARLFDAPIAWSRQ
jgi:hypothetical protein